jgi:hypothetical protein
VSHKLSDEIVYSPCSIFQGHFIGASFIWISAAADELCNSKALVVTCVILDVSGEIVYSPRIFFKEISNGVCLKAI